MGLGIVPFESLSTRLRAIPLDDNSPTDNRFRTAEWPLAARAYLAPLTERGQAALGKLAPLPITNRDPNKLTVLAMTGVTAMARNSAVAIDRSGDPGFLARQVGPELAAADLTTTSNEISIFEGCVADNTLNNVLLCSKPEYWENLALSGIDAIGLTGNHMNDFSYDNFRSTLQLYADKQMPTYGGGGDDKAARKPLILEHNGNRLAFLGSNQWGPEWYRSKLGDTVSAWAGPDNPGALRFDQKQMVADIQAAKQQADVVFAEVQHTEFDAAGDYQVEAAAAGGSRLPGPQRRRRRRGDRHHGARAAGRRAAGWPGDPLRAGQPLLRPDVELAHPHRAGRAPHDLRRQADQHRVAGDGDPG